jgi:hypothetical protein
MLSVHYRLWNRGRVLPIIESVMVTRMARPTDLKGLFEPCYRPKKRQLTLQSSRLPQVKTNRTSPIHRPEWPSPHDCTSSVSYELVLIQLLNLMQAQKLSHFFFGPALQEIFFFHMRTSPAHPTTLFKKYIPTYPAPLPMLRIFFQSSLSFRCHCQCYNYAITHCQRWCLEKN